LQIALIQIGLSVEARNSQAWREKDGSAVKTARGHRRNRPNTAVAQPEAKESLEEKKRGMSGDD